MIILITICVIFNYDYNVKNITDKYVLSILNDNADANINGLQMDLDNKINILHSAINYRLQNNKDAEVDMAFEKFFSQIKFYNKNELQDQKYFDQLIRNGFYVSEPNIDTQKINLFVSQAATNLIACGEFDLSDLKNIFRAQKYSQDISTYITNPDGQIILSLTQNDLAVSDNIFNTYMQSEFKNPDDLYYIVNNLENGLDGDAEYTYDNEKTIVKYQPIKINNWFIFSTLPKNFNSTQTNEIISSTMYFIFLIISSLGVFIFYILYNDKKHMRQISNINNKLEIITENIPGGVQTRLNDADFTLSYVSYGFLKITGYDKNEIYNFFDNKYLSLIYIEDIQTVKKNIEQQLKSDRHFKIEYRITKKNGKIIWVTERGQLVNNIIHSVIIDITELKKTWDTLKKSEQQYKLIAQESDSIVFEFNIKNGTVYSSENFKKILGFDMPFENFPQNIIDQGLIFDNDIQVLLSLFNNIKLGQASGENEFRIKTKTGDLIWCRLSLKLILDANKKPLKAIGKIENINDWKLEQEMLTKKAQTDLLTGLYNKVTTEKLINEYINQDGIEKTSALFAIDIDNFKGVNDNLGHLTGDKVLIDISNKLKKIFRQSDIIGRFGGDEFVVFMKNIPSLELIEKKAQSILKAVKAKIDNNDKCKISASIGVAIYPQNGDSFQQLYENADQALYDTKKTGKNSWKLF